MQKERWTNLQKACEELHSELNKIASVLQRDAIRQQALREDEHLTEDCWKTEMLKFEESGSVHREEEYKGIVALLKDVPLYKPQQINTLLPETPAHRYRLLIKLKEGGLFIAKSTQVVHYTRCYGNNLENLHYLWTGVANDVDLDKQRTAQKVCEDDSPEYHRRYMKRKFVKASNDLKIDCPKSKLRRLYVIATSDASAARTASEREVEHRVMKYVELQDESIITDLRKLNHRPACYDAFFAEAEKYIADQVETSVDDRRHDQVVHLAKAISARDLLEYVYEHDDLCLIAIDLAICIPYNQKVFISRKICHFCYLR